MVHTKRQKTQNLWLMIFTEYTCISVSALRPQSTAAVMSGQSLILAKLFLGKTGERLSIPRAISFTTN